MSQTSTENDLVIEVHGKPEPEPRPRWDSRKRRMYVPDTAHVWKHRIRSVLMIAIHEMQIHDCLPARAPDAFAVGFEFRFERPKSHYRTGRFSGLLSTRNSTPHHTCKPDLDNLVKAAKDAPGNWLKQEPLLWHDDAQVVRYIHDPQKRWCRPGEKPGMTMRIRPIDPMETV